MTDLGWFLVVAVLLFLVMVSGGWRNIVAWFLGPPNIALLDLAEILPPDGAVTLNWDPRKKIQGPGTINVQILRQDRKVSVLYHKTDHGHTLVETVNISAPPYAGIVLTLRDGEIREYERVGGHWTHDPRITPEEQRAVTTLLRRIREIVASERP